MRSREGKRLGEEWDSIMEAKPGNASIREFHFHIYWFQNSSKAGAIFISGARCAHGEDKDSSTMSDAFKAARMPKIARGLGGRD